MERAVGELGQRSSEKEKPEGTMVHQVSPLRRKDGAQGALESPPEQERTRTEEKNQMQGRPEVLRDTDGVFCLIRE